MADPIDIVLRVTENGFELIDQAGNKLTALKQTTQQNTNSFADFAKGSADVVGGFKIISSALNEGTGLIQSLNDLGVTSLRAKAALNTLSGGAGAEYLAAMSNASANLVSNVNLATDASEALSTGIARNSADLTNLTRVGSVLGITFMGDAQSGIQAFERALEHVGQTRPLAALGMNIQEVRDEYTKLTGEGVDKATAWEMALYHVADPLTDKLQPALSSTGTALEKLHTQWDNFWSDFGERVAQGVEGTLNGINPLLDGLNKWSNSQHPFGGASPVMAGLMGGGLVGQQTSDILQSATMRMPFSSLQSQIVAGMPGTFNPDGTPRAPGTSPANSGTPGGIRPQDNPQSLDYMPTGLYDPSVYPDVAPPGYPKGWQPGPGGNAADASTPAFHVGQRLPGGGNGLNQGNIGGGGASTRYVPGEEYYQQYLNLGTQPDATTHYGEPDAYSNFMLPGVNAPAAWGSPLRVGQRLPGGGNGLNQGNIGGGGASTRYAPDQEYYQQYMNRGTQYAGGAEYYQQHLDHDANSETVTSAMYAAGGPDAYSNFTQSQYDPAHRASHQIHQLNQSDGSEDYQKYIDQGTAYTSTIQAQNDAMDAQNALLVTNNNLQDKRLKSIQDAFGASGQTGLSKGIEQSLDHDISSARTTFQQSEQKKGIGGARLQGDLDAFDRQSQAAKDTYEVLTGATTPAAIEFQHALNNLSAEAASGKISITDDAHAMAILGAAASNGTTSVQGMADALRSVADVHMQQQGINMILNSGGFQYGVNTTAPATHVDLTNSQNRSGGEEGYDAHINSGLAGGKAATGPANDPYAATYTTIQQLDKAGPSAFDKIATKSSDANKVLSATKGLVNEIYSGLLAIAGLGSITVPINTPSNGGGSSGSTQAGPKPKKAGNATATAD